MKIFQTCLNNFVRRSPEADGARALARFNVRLARASDKICLLSVLKLKRHKCRAPLAAAAFRRNLSGPSAGEFLPTPQQFLPGGRRENSSAKILFKRETAITKAFHGFFRRVAENLSVAQPLLKGELQ